MKKVISFTFFLIILELSVFAQYDKEGKYQYRQFSDFRKVHWGFTAGVNKIDFMIYKNHNFLNNDTAHYLGIESYSIPGFHLGPLVEFKLGKLFDLRLQVDITFTERSLKYYFLSGSLDSGSVDVKEFPIASSFIEAPLLLKFKSVRYNNIRMYVIGGGNFKYDLATLRKTTDNTTIKLNPYDVYYDIGVGIEWYLPYFKLSTELKYQHGFLDNLQHTGTIYTSPIDKLKTNAFMLSFHFSS